MKQYEMFEVSIHGKEPIASWVEVDVRAEFIWEGHKKSVKGFYAGDGIYKVRFMAEQPGHYSWKVTGVVSASGEEDCVPAENRHGMVMAKGHHFIYADGVDYRPVGTTIYALAHQSDALIDQTLKSLSKSPFNKVRHCVFPKHYDYNENEPKLFAFEKNEDGSWNVHKPCMAFWDHFESVVFRLEAMGIQSDLILFHPYDIWGFSEFSMEENRIYLDYAIRRLSAVPSVWWSMANEYDLMFSRSEQDWYDIEEYIVQEDTYNHLLSNHQCVIMYDFSRPGITHCSIQLGHVEKAGDLIEKYQKPVIYDECAYEGNLAHDWGNLSGFEMANRFWCLYSQGAYATHGEVFLSQDDVLWWAKGGILKGESPVRIAFLNRILDEAHGPLNRWNLNQHAQQGELSNPADQLNGKREDSPLVNFYLHGEGPDREGLFRSPIYAGCYENQFFLRYFAHTCPGITVLYLPEAESYRIEVIDMWNMNREQIFFGASGKTVLELPGREGIAVLAVKIS